MSSDSLGDDLLLWAAEACGGDPGHLMGLSAWPTSGRNPEAAQRAVAHLLARGWAFVGPRHRVASGEVLFFRLTPAGIREAERRKASAGSVRERLFRAENALLAWVAETAEPGRPVELIDFFDSPDVLFHGTKLTYDEVHRASVNLVGLGMLTTTGGPMTGAWLTSEGDSCFMSGLPVREYVRPQAVTLIQHIAPGAVGAQGQNVTQIASDREPS